MGADCCPFPMLKLVSKEADVKGSFRYVNTVSFVSFRVVVHAKLKTGCHPKRFSAAI